jgi:hypothetical protein
LGATGAQELTAFFRTNAQPSGATLEMLLRLMEEFGFDVWDEWLEYLRSLWRDAFGGPLGEFRGAPFSAVRTVRRRY